MAVRKKTKYSYTQKVLANIPRMTKQDKTILFLFGLFVFSACAIIFRLYELQVVEGARYAQVVENQFKGQYSREEFARGNIYFTYKDGNRLLVATNKDYYSVIINNRNLKSPLEAQAALSKVVSFDSNKYKSIITKTNDPYEILLPRITQEEADAVRALRIRGVELHVNSERYYPAGDLASQVIGFVSFSGDELKGNYGLEKYYDNILRRDGELSKRSIFFSLFNKNENTEEDETTIEKNIAKEGSLVASIEPNVQDFFEKELDKINTKYKGVYTAGIVMDPDTGAIISMAASDNFDLNKDTKHYRNYLIEDRRELGSIMKPLTVAAALENEVIDSNFSYNDTGSVTIGRYTINNFDRRGRGPFTSLQTVLTQSLNTGMVKIAALMGADMFIEFVENLGLDSETGVDLPFEVFGSTNNINTRGAVEIANASFGQGIAPTPIEMVRAWSAFANEGKLKTPHVVDLIEYGDLIPAKNIPTDLQEQVFSQETAKTVTDYLINTVDESQTFKPYSLAQHSVAIKSGTAQLAKSTGGYHDDRFLHSFTGFFPAKAKPGEQQYVVLIYIVDPKGARYSSTTLKDGFFNTVKYMINYYDLTPDRNLSTLDNLE